MTRLSNQPLLEIENLVVHFTTRSGIVQGARGVTLQAHFAETLGLVGESGSGKSVTFQAVMGLITTPGEIIAGDLTVTIRAKPVNADIESAADERHAGRIGSSRQSILRVCDADSGHPLGLHADAMGEIPIGRKANARQQC